MLPARFVLIMLLAPGALPSCVSARRSVISAIGSDGPPAKAAAGALEPVFDGADLTRGKVGVRLQLVARDLMLPTDIEPVPGDEPALLVLEKGGKGVLVARDGAKPQPLFEVAVDEEVEQGLLGVAFHPRFAETRRFYLDYNPKSGKPRTRIAEWEWPAAGKPRERRILLEVEQPYQNHKGGQLAFGPDGLLYVGFGDGGWADDPHDNGQNTATMLGKMLRIDVDRADKGKKYGVPKDNPFVGKKGFLPEIWAYGLRNPWRYSFSAKGALIVGDVGQDTLEEVTVLRAGANAGWSIMEGTICHKPKTGCRKDGLTPPVHVYGRDEGHSITGGYEYRGKAIPKLRGSYVFGDYTSGRIWAIPTPEAPGGTVGAGAVQALGRFPLMISTFGRGADGELYVAALEAGAIYRIVASP